MDSLQGGEEVVEKSETGTPIRFVPLDRLYSSSSSTAPCVTGSSMSKKIKAQKLIQQQEHKTPPPSPSPSPPQQQQQPLLSCSTTLRVYARRPKKHRHYSGKLSVLLKRFGSHRPQIPKSDTDAVLDPPLPPRPKSRNFELLSLGIDPNITIPLDCSTQSRLRARPGNNNPSTGYGGSSSKKRKVSEDPHLRWVELSCKDADPTTLVGLTCKVYWPLDDDWYSGSVVSYNSKTLKHEVKYDDGDNENLNLSKEKIKFRLSPEQLEQCDLKKCVVLKKDIDFGEMVVLAASFDDCNELEPGIIIWAKLAGHPAWPAVVVDESGVGVRKQLKPSQGGGITTISVQFFGSYDFARITMKQVISFLKGILASYHLKCRQACFIQSLEEAKMYLTQQKLPERMVLLQNGLEEESGGISSGKGRKGGDKIEEDDKTCPLEFGDLCVISLGNVVTDSEYFHNDQYIWPEGYAAERKFVSVTDPRVNALYKMEVLRDPESISRPLFRITAENGDQFQGPSPAACWNQIYKKIRKMQSVTSNGLKWAEKKSGSHMFGFSTPRVFKLIQELSYRPIRMDWKDLDKCSVCHMDEEYLNNLFMQCDKCRMMVHARCYGEVEAVNGVLWLCNLCRPGAPESPPTCCLCPVIGGAMKPTTNGLWAHLACAIWIPETCFLDIKRMEPIDGINRIHKDRWKLLCSICGVSYGACIQCSHRTCRVAYHPLCARAAGLCVELEDEDRLHLMSFDEDEEDQCINQLSFCKKHRQPSNNECSPGELIEIAPRCCSNYNPPINPSGCARTEPYDFLGRRGRKEPDALAAVSLKRLYVENKPYLVTGYCQNQTIGNASSSNEFGLPESSSFENSKEATKNVLSMAEKYTCMKKTFRKRLAFGKSGIHGFGIFAKRSHRAGDMVIEYTGELVRPSIADRREHFIYNSLVGAGTYMFRIDDERVIDATRAGSIAHLINHSCEPNCYSRAIKVHGDEHIIIFAKRDISEWEELTYDYRFFSIDEQLPCYCGFQRCRGVVNDIEAEEHVAKLCVPRSKLIDWMSTS